MPSENLVEISSLDFPISHVVVYLDRAQVTRVVKAKLLTGINKVVIKNVSAALDENSIRVDGRGAAKLLDVVHTREYKQVHETPELSKSEADMKLQSLTQKIKETRFQSDELVLKRDNLESSKTLLNSLSNHLHEVPKDSSLLDKQDIIGAYLKFHSEKVLEYEMESLKVQREIDELNNQLQILERNIQEVERKTVRRETMVVVNEINILLQSEVEGEVELTVSYMVSNASWSPTYDVRVFSKDKKLDLIYKADICQRTDEPWIDAKIILSTAQPSVSGEQPEFEHPWMIDYYQPPTVAPLMRSFKSSSGPMANALGGSNLFPAAQLDFSAGVPQSTASVQEGSVVPQVLMSTAVANEGLTASTFEIPSLTTIPSDDVSHNVTVAIISLQPDFSHSTTPKMTNSVFLKAKAKNTSEYHLLTGPTNIFLDNNFISKATLKNVSPGEEVEFSLGVDESIRVTYKPLSKVGETTGMLTKQKLLKCHQIIEVKNTKVVDCKLHLVDQIPKSSSTDKIKVAIIEPTGVVTEKDKDGVFMDDLSCLHWNLVLKPNEQKRIDIKYDISSNSGIVVTGI